tara:strand:- start:31 stop:330 length:300 start_codon:yes stop_codon:yes gene_type:complete
MSTFSERANIFRGKVISHRGKTITDIGSSRVYQAFLQSVATSTDHKVAIVPGNMEGRPDLLAYAAYGNELLWWLIIEANNIYDYEVGLAAGNQIIIPSI